MNALLGATRLRKSYRGRPVVTDLSLDVHAHEIVGLLGPNGAGKSTSFHMLAGLVAADGGAVHLCGRALGTMPLYARARLGLAYLPQEPTVLAGLTAAQNLEVALAAQGVPRAERGARMNRALANAALERVAHTQAGQLSGGERRRLEMARALVLAPRVLLLDEPFAGVDPIAVARLQASVRAIAQTGIGVLITDHNVQETLRLCHRAYLLHGGTVLAQGTPDEIVENPLARAHYLGEHFAL